MSNPRSVSMFIYKHNKHRLPKIFKKYFTQVCDIHSHDTRNAKSLRSAFCETNRSQRTMKFYGPKIWNIITNEIDVDCAIGTFKSRLRSLLLSTHNTLFQNIFVRHSSNWNSFLGLVSFSHFYSYFIFLLNKNE